MGQVLYFLSASVSDVPPPVRSPKYGSKKKVEKILEVAAPLTRRYPPSVQETMQASTIRPAAVGLLGMRTPRSSPARKAKFCLACSIKKTLMTTPVPPPVVWKVWKRGEGKYHPTKGIMSRHLRASMNWSPGTSTSTASTRKHSRSRLRIPRGCHTSIFHQKGWFIFSFGPLLSAYGVFLNHNQFLDENND